ncbi:hypothetical protein [Hymenobacter elongatus]|uniref:Lipoprotein n=1 Tax=Hymenobacter elongatus TaxID=877208 RepID=A0A4Z0PPY8_9BACT|nr:hypothetical protein [Hymenobacter elongatus]TGE18935.1 hypothetical protein E5J99_04115 [Hymenobacter elongatus]
MKKHLLLSVSALGLGLVACEKADEKVKNYVVPAPITATFNQDYDLNYQQVARLPTTATPELTVELADLQYTYCPADGCSSNPSLRCVVGTDVSPNLTVTDATGQVQQVRLPANSPAAGSPAWRDTTSIRANGQRYVLYYVKWKMLRCDPAKYDFSVVLRVSKPTTK